VQDLIIKELEHFCAIQDESARLLAELKCETERADELADYLFQEIEKVGQLRAALAPVAAAIRANGRDPHYGFEGKIYLGDSDARAILAAAPEGGKNEAQAPSNDL